MVCIAGGELSSLHDKPQLSFMCKEVQIIERVWIRGDQIRRFILLEGPHPLLPADGEICPACEIPHGRKHLVMKDGQWARFIIEALPLHLLASIAHADKWQRLIQDPCPLWAYQLAKRSVDLGVGLELGS